MARTSEAATGFYGFLEQKGEKWANAKERRSAIESYWAKIAAYPYWDEVLEALELEPTATDLDQIIARTAGSAGGEGPDHLALKNYVCNNPHLVGLKFSDPVGEPEVDLPSGDRVDVVFSQRRRVHAVEVKPAGSSVEDVTRGLFQCIKYRAVMMARAAYEHDDRSFTVCLAFGGELPDALIPLRNSLGIEVFESIVPE